MLVYRGTREILPKEVDIKHITSGYYGRARYYALTAEDAERYARGRNYKLITVYEVDPQSCLSLTKAEVDNLAYFLPHHQLKLAPALAQELGAPLVAQDLCSAVGLKYDAILCTGEVEGGEQLIIPEQSPLAVTIHSYQTSLWMFSAEFGEQLREYLQGQGWPVVKTSGWYTFTVPATHQDFLHDLIIFCGMLQNAMVKSVDFDRRVIEEYEE